MRTARISLYMMMAAFGLSPAATVLAQDNTTAPALRGFQLDPSRDPRRAEPETQGPEVDGRLPQPARPRTDAAPERPVPPPAVVAPTIPRSQPAPSPRTAPPAAVRPTVPAPPEPAPVQTPAPAPDINSNTMTPASPSAPEPLLPENSGQSEVLADGGGGESDVPQWRALSPYILGGLLGLLGAIWLFARMRRRSADDVPSSVPELVDDVEPAAPSLLPTPEPVPLPVTPKPVAPEPVVARAITPPDAPRPWLTLDFQPLYARTTLVGVSIGYRMTISNTGDADVSAVSIAAQMANADAEQPQVLAAFFAEPVNKSVHEILILPAGETISLEGALSLPHNALNAWRINDRLLFIPFVAFNAIYRWGAGHEGQTAQSYIVGREADPPTDRMAPFRLDQGPKEFRPVGCRRSDMAVQR